MRRAQGKSARMLQVERYLLAQREPISQAEVARVCGVNRSTINRMLADLEDFGVPIVQDDKGRISINRDGYLTHIRLTLDESMAVFLAARLLARYSDKPNPHAVEALLKLGLALEQGIAPQIGKHITRTSEALRERHGAIQHNYLRTLETLTKAWSMNYKVRIVYRSLRAKRPFEQTFAPYFLEPSAIGYGTYAIGWAETPQRGISTGKLRTRKVERIESIVLLNEPFEIPADFDPVKLLAGAWGIWFDEEDQPTPVVLRFSHNVARRVRESKWHPSEHVEEDAHTGDLIWRAEIDEWQEIVPWVRQWGADVEVLEPQELREEIAAESLRLARLYGGEKYPSPFLGLGPHQMAQPPANDTTSKPSLGRKTMYYEQYLTALAKTDPAITLFEHSSDVLQVANYLIEQNVNAILRSELVRAGALTHDVGKIKNDRRRDQWIHAPHSKIYLEPLLDDPRFQSLLSQAGVDFTRLDRETLLMICEEHHNPSPKLLRRCKEAILVSVADAIASSIGSGMVGSIAEILRSNPYMQINLELLRSLGFTQGLDGELHHIDLPGQFTQDLFLADMIFRVLDEPLRNAGVIPLLQKGASLWVIGTLDVIRHVLSDSVVDPKQLYDSAFTENIYDAILAQFPPGGMQIDTLKFLLVNEPIARKMAIGLYTRDKPRKLFEKYNLSHLIGTADALFANGLSSGIDALWSSVKAKLMELAPELNLPATLSADVELAARGKRQELALFVKPKAEADKSKPRKASARAQHNSAVLKALQKHDKALAADVEEFLKLFDCSGNYYRSLTNILLELQKMQKDIKNGTLGLPLIKVALIDGQPLAKMSDIPNTELCPICRRFTQEVEAKSLITGRSEGDSKYFESRQHEGAIRICRWCFLAGYVDLPIANIVREGNLVFKEREYLLLNSPLSRDKLQRLIDYFQKRRTQAGNNEQGGDETENAQLDQAELAELETMLGAAEGYDKLAVLGLSQGRLSHLKGFALETANALTRLVAVRIPFEQLVGEDKVSGAVRRELVKATMYDLHLATGAPTMHFNIVSNSAFSVNGQPITLQEMERANLAYRLADKDNFCRHFNDKKIWQLDSALYMLLLSEPWKAVNQALNKLRRRDRTPGEQRIQEVIQMTEKIAQGDQWKFDLGLYITGVLVEVDLLPKARGFWAKEQGGFRERSGVELTKWLQRLKLARDETGLKQWGNQLINALKVGRVASREFRQEHGIEIRSPGEETIGKILALVERIAQTCREHNCKIGEFTRDVAGMDYVLLFSYNQKAKENKQ